MAWEESVWPVMGALWSKCKRHMKNDAVGLSTRQNVLGVKIAPAHQSQGSK